MPWLIGLVAIAIAMIMTKTTGTELTFLDSSYPDIDPSEQGGDFDTQFDDDIKQAADEMGVPFALMKAHAIRESNLKAYAYHLDTNGHASYGILQVEWWRGSGRFNQYGYSDDQIGDGSLLYDPLVNARISAHIIKYNLDHFGNLRDAINAYNTGTKESEVEAPNNYVDDVISNYSTLVKRAVL